MNRLFEIVILIFFVSTSIDMCYGSDTIAWNRFYFIKENAFPLAILAIFYKHLKSTRQMLIGILAMCFFNLRIVFNILFYNQANNWVFALAFTGLIALLLILFLILLRWKK